MQICNGNIADNVDNADNADKADSTTKHTENTMKIINTQTENGSQAGKIPQAGKTAQADITQADSTAPTDSAAQKNAAQTDSAKAQQKNTAQKNAAQPETSLSRSLTDRHILLIALGGAIGTGLFYGSAESISLTGPSILLAYLLGGLIIFLIVRALGEMSAHEPRSGAFSWYASKYWSKRAGFISGWNYWFNYVLVSMVELSVVGTFVRYWFPQIPAWASAAFFLGVIVLSNLAGVKQFGEAEFWLALIKIVAVILMIIGGLVCIIRSTEGIWGTKASFANLFANSSDGPASGFMPYGLISKVVGGSGSSGGETHLAGLLIALVVVMFSFGGTELVSVTAGEAKDPKRSIPRAVNGVIWRILGFYVVALAVIMAVVPWQHIGEPNENGVTVSPFVQIFDSVGIHAAAGILNFVCLTAVISVYNSALYSNSRMLFSLAKQGNAPKFLGRLNSRGIPSAGVFVSAFITAAAVVVVFLWPDFAFNYLMSIATGAAVINWTMIAITHTKFRKHILEHEGQEGIEKLEFKLPLAKFSDIFVILAMACLAAIMFFIPEYRVAVIAIPVWLAALYAASVLHDKKNRG